MARISKILIIVCLAALLAVFGVYMCTASFSNVFSIIASAAACVLFAAIGCRFIPRCLAECTDTQEALPMRELGARSLRRWHRHPIVKFCLIILCTRVFIYVLAYIIALWTKGGYAGGILDMGEIWMKGDAPHYIGIAFQWYVTQGDARFHIVFFPFYPVLVRFFAMAIGNYMASGMLVSNVASIFAGYLLYELALLDMDRNAAARSMKFLFLMPAAFLFNAPMSDSLFLLLSVVCIYLVRRKYYFLGCVAGFLCALTRSLGVVMLVPVGIEYIAWLMQDIKFRRVAIKEGKEVPIARKAIVRRVLRGLCMLLIPAGLAVYFIINKIVTGNPFQFMIYQSEHWSQNFGWFFNTANYQMHYALSTVHADPNAFWGLWLPNIVCFFGSLVIMLLGQKKLRASYVAYFLAYFVSSMGVTWLLSAPRYLLCVFPLALAMGQITRRRRANALLTALCGVGQILYLAAYVAGYPVY